MGVGGRERAWLLVMCKLVGWLIDGMLKGFLSPSPVTIWECFMRMKRGDDNYFYYPGYNRRRKKGVAGGRSNISVLRQRISSPVSSLERVGAGCAVPSRPPGMYARTTDL